MSAPGKLVRSSRWKTGPSKGQRPLGSECCVTSGDSGREAYTAIAWGVGLSPERSDIAGAESFHSLAFASIAWKTGSSSPGEFEMTRSTSAIAACCSRASLSSRLCASSFFSNSARGSRRRSTWVLAFVAFERRPVMRLRLFAPLRDNVTSSVQSLVPFRSAQPGIEPINPNRTAR